MFRVNEADNATIFESFIWERSIRKVSPVASRIAVGQTFIFSIAVEFICSSILLTL